MSRLNAKSRVKTTRSKTMDPTPKNNHRSCGLRHPNKKIPSHNPPKNGYKCNDCDMKLSGAATIFGCRLCKFYLCQVCYKKPSCIKGHKLKIKKIKKNTVCNQCNFKIQIKDDVEFIETYYCKKCSYYMCLGCATYETCPMNHGLKWKKIDKDIKNSNKICKKCHRIFKLNKKMFMCVKCRYSICIDCYTPKNQLKMKYKSKPISLNNGNSNAIKNSTTEVTPKPKNAFEINDLALKNITDKYFNDIDDETKDEQKIFDTTSDAPSVLNKIPSVLIECIICMENDKNVAFTPCGHYVCCETCSIKLMTNNSDDNWKGSCPVCDKAIDSIIKIYD